MIGAMPEQDEFRRTVQRAHRRLDEAMPYSPEWAAAIEAVEALELERGREKRRDRPIHLKVVA